MSSNNRRIQRVPALLIAEDEDEMKKNDYYPKVASIGPYHYGKPELAQVEAFKPVAVDLLFRGEKDSFYQKVLAMIDQVRNCYEEESIDKYSDADLAQMMLRDASLIIVEMEIYLEHGETSRKRKAMIDHFGRLTGAVLFRDFILVENQIPLCVIQLLIELRHEDKGLINNYVNKCIFGEIRPIMKYSRVPLHLLEFMHIILVYDSDRTKESSRGSYSIDMKVMAPNHTLLPGSPQHATKTSNRSDEESSTSNWSIEEGCSGELGGAPEAPNNTFTFRNFAGAPNHTLKLGSRSRKHATETLSRSIYEITYSDEIAHGAAPNHTLIMGSPQHATGTSNKAKKVTHSFRKVMELKARGIHFRPSATQSLLDVRFKSGFFHATLQLPEMFVSHYSKPFFKNLVAYELLPGVETEPTVTSYIDLMQSLVEKPEDLKELRERKILYNQLGSDEQALNVFKDINTHGASDDDLFFIVREKIQAHYNSRIKTWMADLIHTHFRSPWTGIAFLAATAIIALTAAQLYYAAHPPQNS